MALTICHSLRCAYVVAAVTLMLPPFPRNWSHSQYNFPTDLLRKAPRVVFGP